MPPKRTRSAATSGRALTLREINRATLARQMLLARAPIASVEGVRRLVGLQAQWPAQPYVGLWARVAGFQRSDLARRIEDRSVVRATFHRATLHLATADDFVAFRSVLQPVLAQALASRPQDRAKGIDPALLADEARECFEDGPQTFSAVRTFLARKHPKLDARMMGYAVRTHLPLVQVPGEGTWGFASDPAFMLADTWLGRALTESTDARELVRRYLAAFGPASARDAQTWCALRGLGDVFETLRPELLAFTDERGRELFDLADAPVHHGDVDAPPRFLPEFDNLLLAHADRSRVVPDAFRSKVFLSALRVRATVLVDGFVRGAWKITRTKSAATLTVEMFAPLTKAERAAVEEEAEALVKFMEPGAAKRDVKIAR